MNILITGAGLIGCHFAREMQQREHQVVFYDLAPNRDYIRSVVGEAPSVAGDIRDLPALVETMQRHQVGVVLHTAGLIGGKVGEHPYTGFNINVGGAIAVAESVRLCGVRRLVFVSTFGVYNRALQTAAPINEEFPLGSDNPYGASKVACEQVLRAYAAQYGFELAILRPAQVYGRGHYTGGSSGGMAMHSVVAAALQGGPVRVPARFAGASEWVYAKDVAQGAALAAEKPLRQKARAFTLGTGKVSTPQDLAQAVRAARPGVDVVIEPQPPGTPPARGDAPTDITRAREELGYEPQYDLARGIADFITELRKAA